MHQRRFRTLPAALAILAGAISLGPADLNAAQPEDVLGWMEVAGTTVISERSGLSQEPFRLRLMFGYIEHDVENLPFGGLVGFGVFDSGEVMFLGHVDYLPSLAEASYGRSIFPPDHRLEPPQTPHFVMVCALPIKEEGQTHDPVLYAYSERSEPNFRIDKTQEAYWNLHAVWQPVPAKRAESEFGNRDYCGEFLKTKQSPVPMWLAEAEFK